jgi:hypothetical protein
MQNTNPFFHRSLIRNPTYFFGRQRELAEILHLINNGQSLAIVGPRRIGKSSLLLHLSRPEVLAAHGLDPQRFCCIYASGESWSSLQPERLFSRLSIMVRQQLTLAYPDLLLSVDSERACHADLERMLEAVRMQGIQIILLLDEMESFCANPALDASVFARLRALADSGGIVYVTASTQPLIAITGVVPGQLHAPLFNIFAQVRLRLLEQADAATLLQELSTRGGMPFTPAQQSDLLDLAGFHPMLLQIAAYHAYALAVEPVDDPEVGLRQRFLEEAETHWRYFWETLSEADRRLLALLPILSTGDPAGLQRLYNAALIIRQAGGVGYLSQAFQQFVGRQQVAGLLQAPPLTLAPTYRIALLRGRSLTIPPAEYALLTYLVERAGQVVASEELEQLWPPGHGRAQSDQLKTALRALRRLLGSDATCITNVRQLGYAFMPGA